MMTCIGVGHTELREGVGGWGEDNCGRNRTQHVVTCIGVGHTEGGGGGWGGRQLREKQNSACGDVYWCWSH